MSEALIDRQFKESKKAGDERSEFDTGRDRIVHARQFRRLAAKTQVLRPSGSGDHRNRLTHSIEVAQLGRTLARRLNLPEALVEAACLGHDIGHPPFGHPGERQLAECMKDYGGFDANAQTLRVLRHLEKRGSGAPLNLTRGVYWSLIKYPYRRRSALSSTHAQLLDGDPDRTDLEKSGHDVLACERFLYEEDLEDRTSAGSSFCDWLEADVSLKVLHPAARLDAPPPRSLACQVMDWCDDVAYAIHDFEDAVCMKLIFPGSIHLFQEAVSEAVTAEFALRADRHPPAWIETAISKWLAEVDNAIKEAFKVHDHVSAVRQKTRPWLAELINGATVAIEGADGELEIADDHRVLVGVLKHLEHECMISDPDVVMHFRRGANMIKRLFDELMLDPAVIDSRMRGQMLPRPERLAIKAAGEDVERRARVVCDYIASMTDAGIADVYRNVFEAGGTGSTT